ncbi:MAG TPA: hypothetical protein VE974_13230 [Thermoanaerobaculia bacterium]|nr:hypothetical protein [Thermoanaerobaculia bacterium]
MKKKLAVLLFALAFAVPGFGRVISYAPYSDQPSESGVHLRTSRYFALIEGADEDHRHVVLYDSRGEEEPRVIYGPEAVRTVALYEPAGAAPMLFVYARYESAFSSDGGRSWIDVPIAAYDQHFSGIDTGGPYTGGLGGRVLIGNSRHPFVISTWNRIVAIDAHGIARTLPYTGALIGQDRAGERFLLSSNMSEVVMIDLDGSYYRKLFDRPPGTLYYTAGWISPAGEVFVEMQRARGRHLYHYARRQLSFVAGPDGLVPRDDGPWQEGLGFFAVPTHDFRGAWMIQRAPGQPTTLMRYSTARGVETMWSDPAGPEVEALIAGQSGQTLLVQVHVPRDVNVAVPFIDPALAVWRVGQPYPTEYDELFLNEEDNKGFIHLDVDRLEEGEPFVFNSGFEVEYRESGPISPPIGGAGDVIQEWGVVRGSFKQRLLLPGVARMRGAFGSAWTTDVTIYNPLDEPQDVEVHFMPLDPAVQTTSRRTQTVRIPPKRITVIDDVLHSLFMIANGGGSLIFEPAAGVNVFGRTYTRSGEGTYGYGMQAIDFFNSAGPRFPLFFSGAFPGPGFRTNVVLTDTSGRGTATNLTAYGWSSNMILSAAPFVTPAGGVLQVAAPNSPRHYGVSALKLTPTRGTVIPAVIAIDNITNDATYFPPDLPATVPRSIPMIAHTDGPGGSVRSDLYLFNPTDEERYVRLEAKMWDKSMRIIRGVYLDPFEARVIPDVMTNLFHGIFGVARLRYLSDEDGASGAGVRVTSRTYKTTPNGGTYGTLVPPLNNFQIAAPGDTLEILGISGGNAFRTNLALIELSQTNSDHHPEVRVRIFDDKLQELDSFVTTIESTYTKSFEDLFTLRGLTTPRAALIKVEVLTDGLVAAYTTLEDVVTGDTTYLPANLGAKVR